MRTATKLVHLGQSPTGGGDIVPALHVASTYEQRCQEPLRLFYGRGENPTREALEECLAGLEDAAHALVFSSGQAAGMTALSMLEPGDEIIASDDVYGGTYQLLSTLGRPLGLTATYVALDEPGALSSALTDRTRLIWIETPTNPTLKVCDVRQVAAVAHARGVRVLVDNTFATPMLQRPLDLGADISLYSTTKFICGHSDAIGGALVLRDEALRNRFAQYRTIAGNVPGALDCWLIHRGVKTLGIRLERQQENTVKIVEYLRGHRRVGTVYYPDERHPRHETVRGQMSGGGAVASFEYLGDREPLMKGLRLFACAVSLGSVRSLFEFPALMTHRPIPSEKRARLGITDNLVRLAIGIEAADDLIADLDSAL